MKKLLLVTLTFASGFFVHAFFFPDYFITLPQDVLSATTKKETLQTANDTQNTKITFDGKHFSPNHVTVSFTRYVTIINTSKDILMSLTSTERSLATPRGYGYTEAVSMQANKKGTFTVTDTNNPQEKLTIIVK